MKPNPIDHQFMQAALKEAEKVQGDVPVGCVIVRGGQILARGHNRKELTNDPTAHAEILAIREAAAHLGTWRLEGTVLYTTLEPCPMCAEAIIQSRVRKLVFGAYDIKSGAAGSAFNLFLKGRIYPIPEIIGGVLEAQCQTVLVEFFRDAKHGARGQAED